MEKLMRWLAPRSAIGFVVRLLFLIALVAAANITFAMILNDRGLDRLGYSLAHAFFVGGPLIAFFLAVTVFQVRLQRQLWRLSRKDGLTGLNNRRTFLDLAAKLAADKNLGVLLLLDADWFKMINDTYGHRAGDICLKSIAYTLRRNVREEDVLGRIGGEEFAIYLRNTTPEQARVISERLTKPIPFRSDQDEHLTVTLSIGAAVSGDKVSLDEMFAKADSALYRAKLEGRARFIFWDEALQMGRMSVSA
jgi:diguanylate cyclase